MTTQLARGSMRPPPRSPERRRLIGPESQPRPAQPSERTGYAHRARVLLGAFLLAALAFHQDPGATVSDTKIDLTQAPLRFLERALHLWEPGIAFGQLQNQAYGYLFPMGPFFAAGDAVGLSPYAVGRAWWAVLLITAYLGVVFLARAMRLGSPLTGLVAGLVYALSPRMLTVLGPISSEAAPMALLPWVLLPLVLVTSGRLDARRGALLSGVAVLLMGGVNAAATVAVLPLPALWILARAQGRQRLRLAAWWAVAVVLATCWWVGPLLLLGHYSFPFLDYVENAASTTSRTSLAEVLRGSSHWVAYIEVAGRPWWRAGHLLATSPVAVVETTVLAALGLAGLARRDMPYRKFLAGVLLLGLGVITIGYLGPLAGPLAEPLRDALDGPLSPFRNIHKFEPLLRLSVCLGLAHLLAALAVGWRRYVGLGLTTVVMLGTAAPALAGNLAPEGSYAEIPGYWHQAAEWLETEPTGSRALVVPGDGFGQFLWGRTVDEPLQPLARSAWVVRQQAGPISGAGAVRLLDAVETRLAAGRPVPGLATYLARAGITHVLVRNDLAWTRSGAPRPALVRAAVAGSPGLLLGATFGPSGPPSRSGDVVADAGLQLRVPPIEVYRVDDVDGGVGAVEAAERATLYPVAGTAVISGATDALLQLADRGVLDARRAVLLAGDPGAENADGPVFATDSFRRRVVSFGAIRDNASETLPASAPVATGSRPDDFLPVAPTGHQTVARFVGARDVRASTSASRPSAAVDRSVGRQPAAAVDGDPRSAWLSGAVTGPGRQWWEVHFDQARPVDGLSVRLARSQFARAAVTELMVTTDRGSVRTGLGPAQAPVVGLATPPGDAAWLRITATRFGRDGVTRGSFGLADVGLAGLSVRRTLVLPDDLAPAAGSMLLLDASPGGGSGCVVVGRTPRCIPSLVRASEEPVGMDREVTLRSPLAGSTFVATARATADGAVAPFALPGAGPGEPALPPGQAVGVGATSQFVDHPSDSAAAAFDRNPRTSWLAGRNDGRAALTVRWHGSRRVDTVRVRIDADAAASRPTRVRVSGDTGVPVTARLSADGSGWWTASFPALRTSGVSVSFPDLDPVVSRDPFFGELERLPVGVAELSVPAVDDLLDRVREPVVLLGCGVAPAVEVDGREVALTGVTSRQALVLGTPVELRPCDPAAADLPTGVHRVVTSVDAFELTRLTAGARPADGLPAARSLVVRRWTDEHRTVEVGPGAPAYLALTENQNDGWRATLDGRALTPVRLDGWRQAWQVPAGEGGTVRLAFEPARTYRATLAAGLGAVLMLMACLVVPPRGRPAATRPSGGWIVPAVLVLAVLALVAGPWGLLAAGTGTLLVHRRADLVPYVVGGALTSAGLVTAWQLRWPMPWPVLPAAVAQALALIAVGGLVAEVFLPRLLDRSAERDARPAPPAAGAPAPQRAQ